MPFWRKIVSLVRKGFAQISGPRWFIPGQSAINMTEDTAMCVSAYHRGVTYIATQIAKLPWEVKDRENIVQEDAVSRLIGLSPNPEMNAMKWRIFMVMNAIHHGNAYSEIQRDRLGRPVALWPLVSRDVDLVRSEFGDLLYRVRGGNPDGKGGDAFLRPEDVYHLPNFHTKDGLVGQGIVAYARDTLGIQRAADRMASGIFTNGGIPSGIIEVPAKMSDEAYKRLKESWRDENGERKAGGTQILEEGAKYTSVDVDPEMLQFLDSRKFGVLEIARFLGLPPTKLFDSAAATFSNVENANLEVATDTLDAWACNLEMEADVKLLKNRFNGRFTELDLYAVFRGDMTTRANYFSKMMQCGAITPNQIRQREGLAPYAEGNRYYIAVNNFTPADRVDEVIDAQVKGGEKPPARNVNQPEDDPEADKKTLDHAVRLLNQ